MSALLRLLQLTDSSFPTGGYAYSHGLEGLHEMGLLAAEPDVLAFARTQIEETLARQDLPATHLACLAATDDNLPALIALDEQLTALKPVPAFRAASTRIGRQTLESAMPLYPSTIAVRYREAIGQGHADGHQSIAFGIVAAAAGIPVADTLAGFAAMSLNGYVAGAVRLGVIGQGAAQRIIAGLRPDLARAIATAPEVPLSEMGGYTPLIDIAGMRQPDLAARLFAS